MANCKASGFLRLRGLVPWSVWPRGRVASQDCGRGPHVAPCRAYQGLRQVVCSSTVSRVGGRGSRAASSRRVAQYGAY